MEKSPILSYTNVFLFFVAIWLTSVIGFHPTYTSRFPAFEDISWVQHFHGNMMMLWYAMLIVQPILIRYKKISWHKMVGKFSYVLAPIVVYSIFLISEMMYHREVANGAEERVLGHFAIEIPTMFMFSLFYILAMVYRKTPQVHMRYMMGTALLMLGPGLARTLIFVAGAPPIVAIILVYLLPASLALTFLIFDIVKKRNYKPFLTISTFLILHIIIGVNQMSSAWLGFSGWFAHTFFK